MMPVPRPRLFRQMRRLMPVAVLVTALVAVAPSRAMATSVERVHQLRIYEIFETNKTAFHDRFRDHGVRIMKTYGFKIVAMWEAKGKDRTEFVYILDWPKEAVMEAQWARFMADQEWSAIKRATGTKHGRMVGEIQSRVLRLTDYSPHLSGTAPSTRP